MELHERIKELRTQKRYSQYDMAEMLGIGQSTYLQIEKGNTELTISRLIQIANVLEVDIYNILGYKIQDEYKEKFNEVVKNVTENDKQISEIAHNLSKYIKRLEEDIEIKEEEIRKRADKIFVEQIEIILTEIEEILEKATYYNVKKEFIDYLQEKKGSLLKRIEKGV